MSKEFKSCCFTGYRPPKFPFKLCDGDVNFTAFENKLIDAVFSLPDEGCYTFYSGMAMGFDMVAAEIVLLLKQSYKKASIKLICALPFIDQARNFTLDWKKRYKSILSQADETILVSDSYHAGCYQKRNEFMVNNSEFVITWFDGQPGGTKNTLNYAARKDRRIINLCENGCHEYIFEEDYELI